MGHLVACPLVIVSLMGLLRGLRLGCGVQPDPWDQWSRVSCGDSGSPRGSGPRSLPTADAVCREQGRSASLLLSPRPLAGSSPGGPPVPSRLPRKCVPQGLSPRSLPSPAQLVGRSP